jgi:DnaJ family protein A protein 2
MSEKPGKDFYFVIGVERTATDTEIQQAYRKLATRFHPDRFVGDPSASKEAEDKFKEIGEAYDVLKDKQKRSIYDKYGEEGLNGNRGGGFSDIFRQFGFGGGDPSDGVHKGKDITRGLPVALDELYNTVERVIKVTRSRLCKACDGVGASKRDAVTKCNTCHGQGVVLQTRKVGPGFVQQFQTHCPDCKGKGEKVDPEFICKPCNGKRVVEEQSSLNIYIDKGMKDGQKITFDGQADEQPGIQPGSIVFVLQQKPHAVFERDGINLFMKKRIPLVSALTGCEFVVTHLDGRFLHVSTEPGDVVRPGSFKMIEREGMPTYRDPFNKGHLYIQFEVEFPESFSEQILKSVKEAFPNTPVQKEKNDVEAVLEVTEQAHQDHEEGEEGDYEDDDEEQGPRRGGGGGGGGGCSSQ